jgi:CRP/FNR family transcriptional regulator, cyclic AMP receptor protein
MAGEDSLFQKFGREFKADTVLFREGEVGKEMYVIQTGKVNISKKVRDVEKVLATLGQGEFFGEMAIISNKPRTATATVAETAKLLVLDPKTFEAMIRGNAEIAVRMIKKLADRLLEADAQIENLLLGDAASRVVHFLAHTAESRGAKTPKGLRIQVQASELARMLGVKEPQVQDVLEKLDKARIATIESDNVIVPDVQKLREFLEFLEMKQKFGEI